MVVGRIIGWLLIVAAGAVIAMEIVTLATSGEYRVLAAGEVWFKIGPAGINLAQAVIQRYIHPILWDPVIVTVLLWPGWAVLGVPGIMLAWRCRRRRRRRFFRDT